jgi:hypothetical protein
MVYGHEHAIKMEKDGVVNVEVIDLPKQANEIVNT